MDNRTGLCGGCRHARTVTNRRGSVFLLCGRSVTDPRYPRYPALPVLRCPGHEPKEPRDPNREEAGP